MPQKLSQRSSPKKPGPFSVGAAAIASSVAADMVYHSQHLKLTPKGSAPLRPGFVENTKAEGFEGVHGVRWTIAQSATGAAVYDTACTAVTLE